MEDFLKTFGFEEVLFPREYYEEGKKYLSPKLPGGVIEFEARAKCLMRFNSSDHREQVLEVLHSQK